MRISNPRSVGKTRLVPCRSVFSAGELSRWADNGEAVEQGWPRLGGRHLERSKLMLRRKST